MWQLVRDGIRRLWWLYLLAVLSSIFVLFFNDKQEVGVYFSILIIFTTGVFLFAFDTGSYAKYRAHTMLPVSTALRGRAYVILFAFVLPVINILVYLLGAALHFIVPEWIASPAPFFWFITNVFFTTGFVCLFLQITRQGIRFPYGWQKAVWELSSVFFIYLSIILAIYFIYRFGVSKQPWPLQDNAPFYFFLSGLTALFGPKTQTFNIPDMSALGIAAVCIVFTLFKADSFGHWASWLELQQKQRHDDTIFPVNDRAYGFFEPWIREIQNGLKLIGILIFSSFGALILVWTLDSVAFPRFYTGFLTTTPWPFILIIITGLLSIPPIIPWFVALRSLRMLPFSRKSLMFYLSSIPLLVFIAYSGIPLAASLYFKDWTYALNLEWCLIIVFGFSMIANSLVLLSRHTLLTFLALFCPTVIAILIFYSYSDPVYAAQQMTFMYKAFTGVALLAAGYAGLYVTLAYSLPYRTKPWFG